MDELTETLTKLNIPTNQISSEVVQVVMIQAKRHFNSSKENEWNEIAELLWRHLQTGLAKYDDQLLCATCLFSVLPLTENPDLHLNNILLLINKELDLRDKNEEEIKNHSKITEVVSVMYGLFQSAFLTQSSTGDLTYIDDILKSSFKLLLILAYEYSRSTFLAFKTINSFKKILGTSLQGHIFNTAGNILLLNLVNHNWENPITGVRDLNRRIFQMVISNLSEEMYGEIFKQINNFYWNKAKYLMLSEIIENCKCNIHDVINKSDWVEGLMYSLCKPGLVSAGADMYYAILKLLKCDDEWCGLFSNGVLQILSSENTKAIENFTNYWCITTLKKNPSLAKRLIEGLDVAENSDNKIYSTLCLLKQANKLGLLEKDWNATEEKFPKNLVLYGVDSCNTSLRIQAFDVICVSQNKSMPQALEYDIVLKYLQDNINSDCTVLRLGMLNSLNSFLTRLQSTYMTNSNLNTINAKELVSFCEKLQNIIVNCLNLNGNYQRKITTVKLCKLVQDCFYNPPRKMQKQGNRTKSLTLCEMLKKECCWILDENTFVMKLLSLLKDPSDDIRENVIQLLLGHYSKEFKCPVLLNYIIDNALNSMRSKFFYNINCGRSMFKLITNILLAEDSTAKFTSTEDVFLFAYHELVAEYKLKTDIVKSIENGKQLHSLITILYVVLEVCYQNSYKIACLDEHFSDLVLMLEDISNQFAWEDTSTSSDFSKMSDMVESMIARSGYDPDDKDQTKISGLHQIVLNCLWLNVKISCDLASLLIQFTEDIDVIDKCLNIIARVLETCRHKGAIEAAGAAIGRAIQYLTSLPENSSLQQLPYRLLRNKLKDLISEAGAMSSITRRGAGLSIMVHRIVSSDMKKGKPLFHYFMETLLETCAQANSPERESTIDNQKDLPQAIYIHFLTRIVTDSSLASDMMYYSAKLASLAFGNLTCPRWQIRNAALQLYGALIPKLIGQKKASGSDDDTVATVACDEFRTHSPALWTHITKTLAACSHTSEVQAHSNLVPILNILANIAKRYNFSFDIEAQKSTDTTLMNSLISLLHSPLYTVRRLTAKCIFNIFLFEDIYDVIIKQDIQSENYFHGILVLLTGYNKKPCKFYENKNNFVVLKEKFGSILSTGKRSYLCRQLFEEVFCNDVLDINDLHDTLIETRDNAHNPGVYLWAERRIEKIVAKMAWSNVPDILETLLHHDCNNYGTFILRKLKSDQFIPESIILEIAHKLFVFSQKCDNTLIWDILYEISLKDKLINVDVNSILSRLKDNDISYKLYFALPFVVRVSTDYDNLKAVSDVLLNLSDPEKTDTDMRYIAALTNNELAMVFERLPDDIKINAITTAVILLQDEDEDIRNLNVLFYKNIRGGNVINPYICLYKILNSKFLDAVLNNPKQGTETLCEKLSKAFEIKSIDVDKYNPFANDCKNIYCEVPVIRDLIKKLKCS